MRTATFRVQAVHPSLNTWSRQHPMVVAKLKAAFTDVILAAVWEARQAKTWDGRVFRRAVVTYRMHFASNRRVDPDNVTPKFFQDLLVDTGVLEDDDFAHVELRLERGKKARPPWTEIRVEGE